MRRLFCRLLGHTVNSGTGCCTRCGDRFYRAMP